MNTSTSDWKKFIMKNTANIQEVMEYLTSVMRGTSKANVLALSW